MTDFFDYNELDTMIYADTPRFFSFISYQNSVGQSIVKIFGEGTRYSVPDLLDQYSERYKYDSTVGYLFLSTDIEVTRFFDIKEESDRIDVIAAAIYDLATGTVYQTFPNEAIIFEADMFHDNVKDVIVTEVEEELREMGY